MTDNNTFAQIEKNDKAPVLSVVVPVFNEEVALPATYEILNELLEKLGRAYEVVVMDNGSTDKTENVMQDIAFKNPLWRYVRLSRNFGYQNSITCGMSMAQGQAIIVIDVDLQDPPELIHEFLKYWDQGYEIVYGIRIKRVEEPSIRVWMTMQAMRLISWLSDYPLPTHSGDFRLISKRVRDAFVQMPESNRYVRGMIHWLGFKQIGIPYTRRGRQFGGQGRRWGGTGITSLLSVLSSAVFSFSLKPLRLFSMFGGIMLLLCLILMPVYLFLLIVGREPPAGFATLLFFSLINLGVTSLGTGILGEYLGRTYAEVKRRPLWLVDYTLNFDKLASSPDANLVTTEKPQAGF
jgi:polyisoprenyl-phosphate glycosyltransferase